MPVNKSAEKRVRQAQERALRNSAHKTKVKNAVKRYLAAAENDPERAKDLLSSAFRALDRAAAKGAMHPKAADRRKARLARQLPAASTESA